MATTSAPPADYQRFCDGGRAICGIDLTHYRVAQMERRLRTFAERAGHADLDAYLATIRRDAAARDDFLDRMTINVSELFRNPERFSELERTHLPALIAERPTGIRIWSAACSYGAEPYSLAILLQELAPAGRHDLRATDIDRAILARAREGYFGAADLRSVTPARRRRWFSEEGSGRFLVDSALRRAVRFSRLDLLRDAYPGGRDLILCRNVVIYFTDEAKRRIYEGLRAALRPGGILMVGSTESIADHDKLGWEKAGTFFYRRTD